MVVACGMDDYEPSAATAGRPQSFGSRTYMASQNRPRVMLAKTMPGVVPRLRWDVKK